MIRAPMNCCEWIVCERLNRWAAALRVAMARGNSDITPPIHEARSLSELASWLETQPNSLALVEVHRDQLESVLMWLAAARRRFPATCFVAALDLDLTDDKERASSVRPGGQPDVVDALIEAGVAEVANSPRRLHTILAVGRRHAARCAVRSKSSNRDHLSVMAAAWASLPWQDR